MVLIGVGRTATHVGVLTIVNIIGFIDVVELLLIIIRSDKELFPAAHCGGGSDKRLIQNHGGNRDASIIVIIH